MRGRQRSFRRLAAALTLAAAAGSVPAPAQVSQAERDALIDLYQATGGASWTNQTNWLGAEGTECTWYGVTCSASPPFTVLELRLPTNNLTGTLPASIADLASLQILELYGNAIGGTIPDAIGNLGNLFALNLSDNNLTGTLPSTLEDLTHLENLDVKANGLSGPLPDVISRLPALRRLELSNNAFTGPISPEVGDISTLLILLLSHNNLTGSIPDTIWSMPNLDTLDLSGNQLTGTISPLVANLAPTVTAIDLGGNQLSGSIPAELCTLTGLEYLSLRDNRLQWEIPTCIGQLDQLTTLYLSHNTLGGPVPDGIASLTSLEHLWLQGNRLAGALPNGMTALSQLVSLNLEYNALWSESLALSSFLQMHDPGWGDSQTLAPGGLHDLSRTGCSVVLSWNTATFTAQPGGYRVWYAEDPQGPYTPFAVKSNSKDLTTLRVTGLEPLRTYQFAVSTFTGPHPHNLNLVESLPGQPFAATTGPMAGPNTDMDGDPAPAHSDITSLLGYLFDLDAIASADADCDGQANATDLSALISLVWP